MTNKKFEIKDKVRVKKYPKTSMKVSTRYGGKIGHIKGSRHIKGRLWYMVSFGRSHGGFDDQEEFTAGELSYTY